MRPLEIILAVLAASLAAGACLGQRQAPLAYARCEKCHGMPGGGDQKGGPDLADSSLNAEDFSKQVKLGSRWKEKEGRKSPYRWKEMPPQTGVTDEEIAEIFRFVQRPGK